MRRLLTLALASTLLLATACGSGGDDSSADDSDPSSPSSSPSTSPSDPSDQPSDQPSDEPSATPSASPSVKPSKPVRHDEKNPTVAVAKTWKGGQMCGLLTKQQFSAAGVTVPNPKGKPEKDGGCSVDATGPYAGVLYGVPPKGEQWPGAKNTTFFGLSGNTAYAACDGQVVCQLAVAIGDSRWATVIIVGNNPSSDQTAMVASGKKLLSALFVALPAV